MTLELKEQRKLREQRILKRRVWAEKRNGGVGAGEAGKGGAGGGGRWRNNQARNGGMMWREMEKWGPGETRKGEMGIGKSRNYRRKMRNDVAGDGEMGKW